MKAGRGGVRGGEVGQVKASDIKQRISVSLWTCLLNSLLWLKFNDMLYLAIEQQHPRVSYFCVCVVIWCIGNVEAAKVKVE